MSKMVIISGNTSLAPFLTAALSQRHEKKNYSQVRLLTGYVGGY